MRPAIIMGAATIQSPTRSLVEEVPPTPETAGPGDISTDLVEYFVVVVRDPQSLAVMLPALAEVMRSSAIRILDLVAVTTDSNGIGQIVEIDTMRSQAGLRHLDTEVGGLLSSHDIDLVSLALAPESTAIVVVAEDRWAQPLSAAAGRAGGELLAGERISRRRVEEALTGLRQRGGHEQHGTHPELT